MKKFINRSFKTALTLSVLAAAGFLFAPVASADCAYNCGNNGGNNNGLTNITVGGGISLDGFGASKFEGENGFAKTSLDGGGESEITLNAEGGLCDFNCGDGGFTFDANAWQNVRSQAWGESNESGQQATAITAGDLWTGATLKIQRGDVGE